MEIARGLSRLLDRGWQPDRTIVLVGWDGEEYGLLGSTEWVEHYRDELRRDAVAYLNMDGVGGREFGASAVPSLDALIEDVTKRVRDPSGGGTVFDAWTAEGPPEIDRLGSGSDYTAFLDHVGVPALDSGFQTGDPPGGEYHASYDDTFMMENFLDPDYRGPRRRRARDRAACPAPGQRRRASLPLLGLRRGGAWATSRTSTRSRLRARSSTSARSRPRPPLGATAAQAVEARISALLGSGDADTPRRSTGAAAPEQGPSPPGAAAHGGARPARPAWFKHQIYAPGRVTGYAAVFLPALDEAIEDGDAAIAEEYRDLIDRRLERATAVLEEALP